MELIKTKQKGFSLLETILALSILALAITGPLELAIKSIIVSGSSQNQIIALYLAQEGIEYVRNKRDNNILQSNNWLSGLDSCKSANGCYVDIPNDSVGGCSSVCPNLKYDPNGYYYNYQVGDDTIFRRRVKIEVTPGQGGFENAPVGVGGNEARIISTVSWDGKFGSREVILEDYLYKY